MSVPGLCVCKGHACSPLVSAEAAVSRGEGRVCEGMKDGGQGFGRAVPRLTLSGLQLVFQ